MTPNTNELAMILGKERLMPLVKNERTELKSARRSLDHSLERTAETYWEKIFDDPSLRRLLRDGHGSEVAEELRTQVEEEQ